MPWPSRGAAQRAVTQLVSLDAFCGVQTSAGPVPAALGACQQAVYAALLAAPRRPDLILPRGWSAVQASTRELVLGSGFESSAVLRARYELMRHGVVLQISRGVGHAGGIYAVPTDALQPGPVLP